MPSPEFNVETFFGWDELPQKYRDLTDPPYSKWDCYSYLVVTLPTGSILIHDDHMEPEDATFHRDLRWIKPLLIQVFKEGQGAKK